MSNYAQKSDASATFDRLVTYDNPGIGKEFTTSGRQLSQKRDHEARRSKLVVNSWAGVSALSDTQPMQKSSLTNMCKYDTHRANVHSVVSLGVFVVLGSAAGVVVAILIRNLNM